jgi:Zn-dependent metalloprotease
MCQEGTHRHSLFCILPPYILRQIALNGSASQRATALKTLAVDQTFRTLRTLRLAAPIGAAAPGVPGTPGQKQRTIFDARHSENLPGQVVRAEGGAPLGDPEVNEAYNGLGATYDFYWEVFERNSIDDHGTPLNATVHFGEGFNNAFFDGQRMVFGDGDGHFFNRFTLALDVIGHELTHGVTEVEAQLVYLNQAGALNESMSDVFGSLVKQKLLNQDAGQADWLIGAGLLTSNVQGQALRSMKDPGNAFHDPVFGDDPQPGHMRYYVHTVEDNGGVHINSGIPNKAFFLAATTIGGFAWEKAGRIWYDTLRDPHLRPNSSFRRFARLTVANAARRFGHGSPEEHAVRGAWAEVGVRAV